MQKRIKMNSQNLQEAFPEVYKDFFSKCDVVASSSGSFCFAGEYDVLYGGLAILQKLPLNIYVGLEKIGEDEIEDGGGVCFIPSEQKFKPFKSIISAHKNRKINNLFSKELEKIPENQKINGFRFFYIFEEPVSSGMNSSAAFSSSFALAFLVMTNQVSTKEIEEWKNQKSFKLIENPSFKKVFRLSIKIESIIHEGTSSGASIFASMIDSFYPIIYFSEKRLGVETPEGKARLPVVVDNELEVYDKLNYKGFKLDEILKISNEWPIDFGLISSGESIRSSFVMKTTEAQRFFLGKAREFLQETLGEQLKFMPDTMLHDVIRHPQELWINYVKTINNTTILNFFNIYYIFKFGVSNSNIQDLIDSVDANHDALSLIGLSSEKLDTICTKIKNTAKNSNNQAGCKIAGAGKKGSVLFITTFDGLRDLMQDILNDLRKEIGNDLFLDYASWIDGVGGEKLEIKQDLSKEIYSKFISVGSIKLKQLDKSGTMVQKIVTKEEFEKIRKEAMVLLDMAEGDIFIQGKKLTSKDIHSARETANILGILIDQFGKLVSNHDLPRSSYSMERGEMQSKIVGPFIKVVKKYLNKKMPLNISGGAAEFSLSLKPGVEIVVVERVF